MKRSARSDGKQEVKRSKKSREAGRREKMSDGHSDVGAGWN